MCIGLVWTQKSRLLLECVKRVASMETIYNLPTIEDHPWSKTTAPFQRVHVDFAGPFLGSMWLLLVDSYSKWPEIVQMNANTTSGATI